MTEPQQVALPLHVEQTPRCQGCGDLLQVHCLGCDPTPARVTPADAKRIRAELRAELETINAYRLRNGLEPLD